MTAFKLEFSEDDLSVANNACVRVDISELVEKNTLKWSGGIERLGEAPKPGQMSFVLRGRDFEPLNASSPYYPNVKRGTRFFLSFLRGATWQQEYVGYARTFQPTWPGNVTFQTVAVECGDGFDRLAQARLPELDPPTATSVPEVVAFDEPWGYYRLGEEAGTKLVAQIRVSKKGRGKKRRTVRKRIVREETLAEVGGVSGPSGTYKNTPLLGQPGAILGDQDTAVWFRNAQGEYATIPVDFDDLNGSNRLTVEAWVMAKSANATATTRYIVKSPDASAGGAVWRLTHVNDGYSFLLLHSSGSLEVIGPTPTLDVWEHVVVTWDGVVASMYVDGVFVASESDGPVTMSAAVSGALTISGTSTNAFDGLIDEVALYEKVLAEERIQAHYIAATARGFPVQTAGERIAEACDLSLWDTSGIQTTGLNVVPVMKHGQSPLEVVEETMRAEGERPLFSFDRDGNPQYRGWEWQSEPPYDEPQAIFGAPRQSGELYFDTESLRYDDEVYNEVTKARVGGLAHTVSLDVPDNERAAAEPDTELLLTNDADVPLLCHEYLDIYSEARYVLEQLTVHGGDDAALDLILDSHIGTRIRYRRRVIEDDDETLSLAHDIVTHIIGFEGVYNEEDNIIMTWKLARGIDMTAGLWRLGLVGASELDTTTVLA